MGDQTDNQVCNQAADQKITKSKEGVIGPIIGSIIIIILIILGGLYILDHIRSNTNPTEEVQSVPNAENVDDVDQNPKFGDDANSEVNQ